jgi:hypothetical protein
MNDGGVAKWYVDTATGNVNSLGTLAQTGLITATGGLTTPANLVTTGTGNLTIANKVAIGAGATLGAHIDLGTDIVDNKILLYDNGFTHYGLGIASNQLRIYSPNDSSIIFGTMSTADGTTFVEKARMNGLTNAFSVGGTDITSPLYVNATYAELQNLRVRYAIRSNNASQKCVSVNYAPTGWTDAECWWTGPFAISTYTATTQDTFRVYTDSACTVTSDDTGAHRVAYGDATANAWYFKVAVTGGLYTYMDCQHGVAEPTAVELTTG